MKTMITLGDMADKGMTMLEVACRRCDRRGRLSIARLIAEHGREDGVDLRALIAHDCPEDAEPAARHLRPLRGALPGTGSDHPAPLIGERFGPFRRERQRVLQSTQRRPRLIELVHRRAPMDASGDFLDLALQ
jgi:hypothetical protein